MCDFFSVIASSQSSNATPTFRTFISRINIGSNTTTCVFIKPVLPQYFTGSTVKKSYCRSSKSYRISTFILMNTENLKSFALRDEMSGM